MCGIAGFWRQSPTDSAGDLKSLAMRMVDSLRHRGPDDAGVWVDESVGLALGHRRLAILELSPMGHQPMASKDGRYTIVFNGEIYNFRELSDQLVSLGHKFAGHSDTEVMLAALSHWGVVAALERFVGMFAFVLWDRIERKLYLARDRMGEKPLYYGWQGRCFFFGSELKAFRRHPEWQGSIDRRAVTLFSQHGYIPSPFSIFEGIQKLPPGCCLELDWSGLRSRRMVEPQPYWSLRQAVERARQAPFKGGPEEAVEQLNALLRESVRLQMIADVPLGAFLSGGIDSTAVVGVMQSLVRRPVRTFTIGFREPRFNEAHHAKAVARHLGTDHTELHVTPKEAMAVIPKLPVVYDEPFSDSSQIPTLLVAELARQHVTVSLSGDAGDELFGGYDRYRIAQSTWQRVSRIPLPLRRQMSRLLQLLPARFWDALFNPVMVAVRQPHFRNRVGGRVQRLVRILDLESPDPMYRGLITHWASDVLAEGVDEGISIDTIRSKPPGISFEQGMMFLDCVSYLPDDILVKVDRASMAVSLESRIPLLDFRIVEFAWSLPLELKMRAGVGKWLLRQVLYRYVPPSLVERPKMGFGVPVGEWIRGPLRDWAEALLDSHRLDSDGFFRSKRVRAVWEEHVTGQRSFDYLLWDILMFQAWLTQASSKFE